MKKIGTIKYFNDETGPIPVITVGGIRLPIEEFAYEIKIGQIGTISIKMPASMFEMEEQGHGKS